MSSDDWFSDIDDAALAEIDRIEAEATQKAEAPVSRLSEPDPDDSYFDVDLDIPTEELERLDQFVQDSYEGRAKPTSQPVSRANSRQTTLFGDILPNEPPKAKTLSRAPSTNLQRSESTARRQFGRPPPKTKQWDQTAFAKTGRKSGKSKGKGKARDEDDEEEEEAVEFEQFPTPFVPIGGPPPMKLKPDLLEAKHWIYPLNRPKRDYQFNIVKHCLFENTIVALPTGLGKTFIAGVVMLNFYRWYPEGKVVFVAPTRPLVAQQIDASHKACGIPGSDAVELTGNIPPAMREGAWREKRVFYMTPQTLINDLDKKTCDARDIVLLVVDEAHRATGNYAYNQVVQYMMATNPHFRLLALTATPGSNPEAVQNLIDGLHISHIEIRDENSIDLKQYIHEKRVEQHIIDMDGNVRKIRDSLAKLMLQVLKPVENVLRGTKDPCRINYFAPQAQARDLGRNQNWARKGLTDLSRLARIMGYLLEGTVGMCYSSIKELADSDDPKKGTKKLTSDPLFKDVLKQLEQQRRTPSDAEHPGGFSLHPKMEKVKAIIIDHFAQEMDQQEETETRVMVFVTFREAVGEIVEALNFERPLIRATKFIGQGTDKKGGKGMSQKEQQAIIQRFKAGEFNVLVATSIGEEGLDIGEVDLIVCYDSQKTPIRMLQRLGRTGRKRAGIVHVLLAEGREELNLEKAKDAYKQVQQSIVRGDQLELYADVERMLPDDIKPECLEKVMEIQEYVREEPRASRTSSTASKGAKRKRNDDPGRNIPDGASRNFVSVKDLIIANSKKRKVQERDFSEAGTDDEDDKDIDAGVTAAASSFRRTESEKVPSKRAKTAGKSKLQRAATTSAVKLDKTTATKAGAKGKGKGKDKSKAESPAKEFTASQFDRAGEDDFDDMEVETVAIPTGGFVSASSLDIRGRAARTSARSSSPEEPLANTSTTLASSPSPPPKKISKKKKRSSSPSSPAAARGPIDILSSPEPESHSPQRPSLSPRRSSPSPAYPSPEAVADRSMAWLVDDDDDASEDIMIVNSSPARSSPVPDLQPSPARSSPQRPLLMPSTPGDSDIEIVDTMLVRRRTRSPPAEARGSQRVNRPAKRARVRTPSPDADTSIEFVDEPLDHILAHSAPSQSTAGTSKSQQGLSEGVQRSKFKPSKAPKNLSTAEEDSRAMPPPPIPLPRSSSMPSPTGPPPLTQPIRGPGRKRARIIEIPSDSPEEHTSPPRRLYRRQTSPTETRRRQKKQEAPLLPRKRNALFDYAAEHSGDEVSAGESGSEEEEEEEDRRFVTELPATQASPSYQQTQAYMQGLMTQAPSGLDFGARPVRRGKFGRAELLSNRRREGVSSSPPPEEEDGEPNEYSFGSFVVDDDAEISYLTSSES